MRGENINMYVVDASYALSFLIADERSEDVDDFFHSYTDGKINVISTNLLPFEVLNGLMMAFRRKRINENQLTEMAKNFLSLNIPLVANDYTHCLTHARRYGLTIYDASYLVLANSERAILKTHDIQLKKFTSR